MNKKLIAPILTIFVGITWFLNVLQVIPGIDWVWTVGLAVAGILSIAVGGLNKISVITGPFLVVASICSFLRQNNQLTVDWEIPILVIALGVLMLISQLTNLPVPEMFKVDNEEE
jgi:hypothetical protein